MIKNSVPTIYDIDVAESESQSFHNGHLPYSKPVAMPSKVDVDGSTVGDQSFLTLYELYNILTAETWLRQPQLLNDDYLLLLDCR